MCIFVAPHSRRKTKNTLQPHERNATAKASIWDLYMNMQRAAGIEHSASKAHVACGQADTHKDEQQALLAVVHLRHGLEQQHSLAPGCIDFIPLHGSVSSAAQAEAPDGAKGAIMPDPEDIMVHIGLLQSLQVGSTVLHLQQCRAMGELYSGYRRKQE